MDCSQCHESFPLAQPNSTTCPLCDARARDGISDGELDRLKSVIQCAGCGCYGTKRCLCAACLRTLLSSSTLVYPLSSNPAVVTYLCEARQSMSNAATLFASPVQPSQPTQPTMPPHPTANEVQIPLELGGLGPDASQGLSIFTQPTPATQPPVTQTPAPLGFQFNAAQQAQYSELAQRAMVHQSQASEYRLTGTRGQNPQLRTASRAKQTINDQRKVEKAAAKNGSLSVAAFVYYLHSARYGAPTMLSTVGPFNKNFPYQSSESISASQIITSFLDSIAEMVPQKFPGCNKVTSENVELRIHDGAASKTLWALEPEKRRLLASITSPEALFKFCVTQGWCKGEGNHKLSLAYILSGDEVILKALGKDKDSKKGKKRTASEYSDDEDFRASRQSSATDSRASRRKSMFSSFERPSPLLSSSSAFALPFPLQYTEYAFSERREMKINHHTGAISQFMPDSAIGIEFLELSENLVEGYELTRKPGAAGSTPSDEWYRHGVIGKGYYKLAINARYGGRDWALLFCHGEPFSPSMGSNDAKNHLTRELEALKLGQFFFLPAFEKLMQEAGFSTLPKLRFNAEDAFIARLQLPGRIEVPLVDVNHPEGYPDGRTVPLLEDKGFFLMQSLIPYGATQPQVIKFTSSDGDGPTPPNMSDRVKLGESTVQAFAHFVYLYSKMTMLLTDLQGVWASDGSNSITLIDPQLLKADLPGEQKTIEVYIANHTCGKICKKLGLDDMEVASPSPQNGAAQLEDDNDDREEDPDYEEGDL